jgi:hypothetical protein
VKPEREGGERPEGGNRIHEALYGIDVLVKLGIILPERVEELRREADEIISITVSSIKTARRNAKNQ